jgi:beta-adrenergic-receptor kinase
VEGEVLKLGGPFLQAWQKKHLKLYPNRLEFYHKNRDGRSTRLVYSASSLKQQSVNRHVTPLAHIILILSQPVFVLSP